MTMVRGSNPIWYEVDLTAHAFDDTFYMFVLDNEIPYAPLPTWQDPFGNVAWDNPIRFLANGTLPNNLYFDPDTVYRLEFRQGNTQSDPLIYLVENYVPGSNGDTPINETSFSTDNQVSNPQFALVNFVTPTTTYSSISTQVINIAPGWFLHLTGTGNVILTQVTLNSSIVNPTNASYALQIQLNGSWTNAYLSQRFTKNGVLWSNSFVSSSIMALSGNAPQNISATLIDSQGNTLTTVLKNTPLTEAFNAYPGIGQIGASMDTDFPPTAYIEYQLLLPNNCNITLSSVQLISGDVNLEYPYVQTTIERQIDQTFHYYKPKLDFKPISSYLIGWTFPLNPKQFGSSGSLGAIGANTGNYVWDQTIVYQSVSNSVSYNTNSNGDLVLIMTAQGQTAIIQYLTAPQIYDLLTRNMSVSATLSNSASAKCTISLWYSTNSTLPNIPINTNYQTFINSLDAVGHPNSVLSGWTEIVNINGTATFTPAVGINDIDAATIGFNGWEAFPLVTAVGATYFAIVIGTATMPSSSTIEFNQVSLVPGDIPTIAAPQTFDEVLRECQHYYEKSYALSTLPGSNTTANQKLISMNSLSVNGSNNAAAYATPFELDYSTKRKPPNITLYTPSGTSGSVLASLNYLTPTSLVFSTQTATCMLSTFWATPVIGSNKTSYFPSAGTSLASTTNASNSNQYSSASIAYQFVADARLGIV